MHKNWLEAVFAQGGLGLGSEGNRYDAGAFGGRIYLVIFKIGGVVSLVQPTSAAVAARAARMNLKDAFITANAYYPAKIHISTYITKSNFANTPQ